MGKITQVIAADDALKAAGLQRVAESESPQHAQLYNNPPLTRQSSPWHASVDGIHLALQVVFRAYVDLRARLVAIQESAGHKGEAHSKGIEHLQVGPYLVRVWPTGSRNDRSGPFFKFVIEYAGIVIMIQDRAAPKGDCPNIIVHIGGLVCLELGDLGALELAYDIIRHLGGEIDRVKLSRVDFCVDMPGVGMDEFAAAANERRYVSRLKRYRDIESGDRDKEFCGLTTRFGKLPLQLAVYDKLAEVHVGRNSRKLELMMARRWNGEMPAQAVRVEFRLWREKLREFGVDTPEDFYRKRRTMIDYLCRDWFRFTAGPVDRQNTMRAITLPLWVDVHEAFAEWAGQPNGEVLEPLPKGPVDVTNLLKSGYGLLRAIGRAQEREAVPFDDYCAWVLEDGLV